MIDNLIDRTYVKQPHKFPDWGCIGLLSNHQPDNIDIKQPFNVTSLDMSISKMDPFSSACVCIEFKVHAPFHLLLVSQCVTKTQCLRSLCVTGRESSSLHCSPCSTGGLIQCGRGKKVSGRWFRECSRLETCKRGFSLPNHIPFRPASKADAFV